jgi:hypothetical protein
MLHEVSISELLNLLGITTETEECMYNPSPQHSSHFVLNGWVDWCCNVTTDHTCTTFGVAAHHHINHFTSVLNNRNTSMAAWYDVALRALSRASRVSTSKVESQS